MVLICGPFGKMRLFITGERGSLKTFCATPDCMVTEEVCSPDPGGGGERGAEPDAMEGGCGRCREREKEGEEGTGGERGGLASALSLPPPGLSRWEAPFGVGPPGLGS